MSRACSNLQTASAVLAGIESQRVGQTSRYAGVVCFIWVFMTGLLWSRGYQAGAAICSVQVFVMLLLMHLHQGKNSLRSHQHFTNWFLGTSCVSVFLIAVLDSAVSEVLYLLPLGIVMASQVLGLRGALALLVVNLSAFFSFPIIFDGSPWQWSAITYDIFFLNCGVAFGTFLSCVQSEILYRNRTETLVDLGEKLFRQATHDSLTSLMNRRQFACDLDAGLSEANAELRRLSLLMIDLDGFKLVNDSLGHVVGDDVLCEIASRLMARSTNAYRLGGDEFCIIVSDVEDLKSLFDFAASVHESLCEPYMADDASHQLGASVGIATFPDDATTAGDLISFADAAMYHAKENRLGIMHYHDELASELIRTTKTQNRLARALEFDEFFLVYQPQVDLASGRAIGVEALLRWRCDGQVVSPGEFVPLLEKSRLIVPVGRWLIREVCRQLRDWTDQGYSVCIAVNVSVEQFRDPDFAVCVKEAIDEFGVDASRLDFEVTEGVLIESVDEVVDRLHQLKELGSTISIDDFGTGYSSLAYLQSLPLDTLKIDQEFIKGIPSRDDGTIASSVIVLAKSLGLSTVAEGIETEQQLAFVKQHDCDRYQGFYHSRPSHPEEVTKFFLRQGMGTAVACAAPRGGVTTESIDLGAEPAALRRNT